MRTTITRGSKAPALTVALAVVATALALRNPSNDVNFLIAPVAKTVTLFTGSPFSVLGEGMAFPALGMVIDRSCSGATFLIVYLAVSALLLWRSLGSARGAWAWAIGLLVLAYPFTVLVNSARIIGILQVQQMLGPLSAASHEALGAFILLGFLFMFSLLLTHLMRYYPRHAGMEHHAHTA